MANFAFFCRLFCLVYISRSVKAVTLIEPYPKNVYTISGSAVNSTCIFVGNNGTPPIKVTFQRRNENTMQWFEIPNTERVFQTNKTEGDTTSATLHFLNITEQDDHSYGKYQCVGSSATGSDTNGFTVRVTPREHLPVAQVIPNMLVSRGDSVRLYCNLTHQNNEQTAPIDKVTYLRGNSPVKITNAVDQALIFPSVRARDGGNYVCRIRVLLHSVKPYEVTSSPAYLHVRLRFPIKESKLVAYIGDSVALLCSAEGFPLDIEWKKHEPGTTAVVKPEGRILLQGDCYYCDSILLIQNVTAEDSGNYSCGARDGSGQQFFQVTVNYNSTSVAVTHMGPYYMSTIMPAFVWIWWPSMW